MDDEKFAGMTPEELGLKAPCIFTFMPSKRIFSLLFKRGTQIYDEITELNPGESKNDPRPKDEPEKVNLSNVGEQIVNNGVDEKFNQLRVLPPPELDYPCFIKHRKYFYEMIGLPHLREKYEKFEAHCKALAE